MVCPPAAWGSHLVHFTGNKDHNVALRGRALDRGLSLSEKGFKVVETGELVPAADLLSQVGTVPGLSKVLDRLGHGDDASPGDVAAAIEFVLEGLHLTRRIDKDSVAGRSVYGA